MYLFFFFGIRVCFHIIDKRGGEAKKKLTSKVRSINDGW